MGVSRSFRWAAVGGLTLAVLTALAPATASAECARPAPVFERATISADPARVVAGDSAQVFVSAGGQWAAFARAIRVTAVNAATGARTDLGAAPAAPPLAVRFTPPAPGVFSFEATWEEGTCLSDDGREITAWQARSTTGGRLEVVTAPARTPKVSLRAFTRTRPGGARIGAGVRLGLDCGGLLRFRPPGVAETVVRWTTDGRAPGPSSRALRARAPSCSDDAGGIRQVGTAAFEARQTVAGASVMSPGNQGLALPGGRFPRPGPVIRVWLELRLGGKVLIATRARFTQRVVRGRFCTRPGGGAQRCRLLRHVQTDVAPDAGTCPGMPGDRCRTFARRLG
jgi:hypothetical protein